MLPRGVVLAPGPKSSPWIRFASSSWRWRSSSGPSGPRKARVDNASFMFASWAASARCSEASVA